MTSLHTALYDFWGSFGLPVWHIDTVDDGASLPYFTFDAVKGDTLSATILTATAWFRDEGQGVNAQRAELMDRISSAIPPQGVKVQAGNGYLMIYRNSASFLSYVSDPEDKRILGARVRVEVHFYLM